MQALSGGGRAAIAVIGFVWFAIAATLVALLLFKSPTWWLAPLPALFAVFGWKIMAKALGGTGAAGTNDVVPLWLDDPEPRVGGRLHARIVLYKDTGPAEAFEARLTCAREDANRRALEYPWDLRPPHVFPATTGDNSISASIFVDLPAGIAASGPVPGSTGENYVWRIRVSAVPDAAVLNRTYVVDIGAAIPGAAPLPPLQLPERKVATPAVRVAPAAAKIVATPAGSDAAHEPAGSGAAQEPAGASFRLVRVAANLLPVAGIAWLGWRLNDVLILYWVESVLIGVFHFLRLLFVSPALRDGTPRTLLSALFDRLGLKLLLSSGLLSVYALSCEMYGYVVASIAGAPRDLHAGAAWLAGELLKEQGSLIAVAALFASHLYMFLRNYLGRHLYARASVSPRFLFAPYSRLVVMHLGLFIFAFAAQGSASAPLAAFIFVALKIVVEEFQQRAPQ